MSSGVTVCLNCRLRSTLHELTKSRQPWMQSRHLANAVRQRKSPARMILSDDVGQSSKSKRRSRDEGEAGPFRGMNRTTASLRPSSRRMSATTSRNRSDEQPKRKDKDERPLFHALKMQATLTPMSYDARTSLKDKLDRIETFDQLGLRPDVLDAVRTQVLPQLETLTPSPVQKLAVPVLLSRKGQLEKKRKNSLEHEYDQFLIAAETGSGKTLAYLLPIINALKIQEELEKAEKEEKEEKEASQTIDKATKKENVFEVENPKLADAQNPDSATGRPRVLILQPSSELVEQVGKVVKSMSHTIKYRSAPISSSHSPVVIRSRLFNPKGIDIIISTPHLISSIAEKEPNILSRVNCIVVDEADSLFDRSFRDITLGIIDRAAPSLKQLILCSATIPRSLDTFIDKRFQGMRRLVTPKIHSVPRRVQLGVLDLDKDPYRGNKDLACAEVIWKLGKAVHDDVGAHYLIKHIIVFVNEREKAEELAAFLAAKGIDATAYTRDTSERKESDVLESFTYSGKIEGKPKKVPGSFIPFQGLDHYGRPEKPSMKKLENTKVLVTTDLGSRGIDTLAVRHAVLYDVPHTTIDFIHRLGRLGRMNRRGRAIVLVARKDRRDIVREVKEAMFKGQALI